MTFVCLILYLKTFLVWNLKHAQTLHDVVDTMTNNPRMTFELSEGNRRTRIGWVSIRNFQLFVRQRRRDTSCHDNHWVPNNYSPGENLFATVTIIITIDALLAVTIIVIIVATAIAIVIVIIIVITMFPSWSASLPPFLWKLWPKKQTNENLKQTSSS